MRAGAIGFTVLVLAGCQSPPAAHINGCRPTVLPRKPLMVAQSARDSAVSVSAHPAWSTFAIATEPLAFLRAMFTGVAQKRVAIKLLGPPPALAPCRPTLDRDRFETTARRISRMPPSPADVRLYHDGCEALRTLDNVIDGARCRIDVLMFLWGNDPVGWRVARKLAAKAGPDLPVRVLVDGGGNLVLGEPKDASVEEVNRAVCWLARQPYVTVVRTRNANFHFDHRKLVVADGRIAWTGGRNFVQSAFDEGRDLTYTIAGPLAADLAAEFEAFWHRQGGSPAVPIPSPTSAEAPNAQARLVATDSKERSLARVLYNAVEQAEHHVYIENPYFSDSRLIYLLAKARHRGVDVRVVLTLTSDSTMYDHSNRVTANRLFQAGVRVYLYPAKTHVKAMTVDGVWAYTGTGNFDNLSLRHNHELGLAVSDGPVIRELEERVFLPAFRPEWELAEPLPVSPLDYLYELIASTFA